MQFQRFLRSTTLVCLVGLLITGALAAAERPGAPDEARLLEDFFTAETIDTGDFAAVFLKQVPADQLQSVRDQVAAALGAFKRIEGAEGNYRAVFEKGYVPVQIHLNDRGKIDGLFLKPPVTTASEAAPDDRTAAEMEALKKFFTAESIDPDWFAQSFLNQVPAAQLKPIREQVTGSLGKFLRIEPDESGDGYRSIFEKGYVPTTISLDAEGKIRGLFLRPPVLEVDSSAEVIDALETMDGTVAVYVTHNGSPIHELNAEHPMAVGSAFKLSILAALLAEIEAGERSWSDVYTLEVADKSLPHGALRNWPKGAPLTLFSLAARMIATSDNTATDALLHLLGRSAVEAQAPERNRPFLTTREAFILKNPENAQATETWLAANTDGRREQLSAINDLPLPMAADFETATALQPEIEWFYTGPELCAVMGRVAAAEVTQINTGGLPEADEWETVSFKGGSEPGVINLTYQLTDGEGDTYCVTASRNHDTTFDFTPFVAQVHALIGTLG